MPFLSDSSQLSFLKKCFLTDATRAEDTPSPLFRTSLKASSYRRVSCHTTAYFRTRPRPLCVAVRVRRNWKESVQSAPPCAPPCASSRAYDTASILRRRCGTQKLKRVDGKSIALLETRVVNYVDWAPVQYSPNECEWQKYTVIFVAVATGELS